jgi:hypothetical protein
MKKWIIALTLATAVATANASVVKSAGTQKGVSTLSPMAAAQPGHMLGVIDWFTGFSELGTLLSIGTIFVGSSMLFSFRRPSA